MQVERTAETVQISVAGETITVNQSTAEELQSAIASALVDKREFARTIGIRRSDGRYEVRRRNSTSSGNAKVFESTAALRESFTELPDTLSATEMEELGLTGSRRHLVLWHFIEHPGFPCEIQSRNPLRAQKL